MSISDLCTNFITSTKLKDDAERNIIEFAEAYWGLGLGSVPGVPPLFPVQKFIFKCYYNIELDNTKRDIIIRDRFNEKDRFRFTEIEYLIFLQDEGRINISEVTGDVSDTRQNLCLVIGRRGLKTSTIAVLISFEIYKLLKHTSPQEFYRIMPDDEIQFSCIATDKEQASELFRRIGGHIERSEYFKKYRSKPTQYYMRLDTQRDIEHYGSRQRPSLRVVASPCSARGLRSKNNIIVVLDEMAHFFESEKGSDKSDRAVYESVTPSVAKFNADDGEPHGKVICISSPADRTGKFHEIYQRSMEKDCNDWLMVNAPSWEVDYTLSPKYLRNKYIENAISYNSEFGGQFSDRVSAWIDNEQILRINIIPGMKFKEMTYERTPHFLGIDVGLKNDGTAIAITHIVKEERGGEMKNVIELDCIEVRYAKDEGKEFFNPDEMAEWIASFMKKFFIVKGMMDQYYGLAMLPVLHKKGHKQIDVRQCSRDFNSRVYQNLMAKMLDASLRIPEGPERVVDGKKTKDIDLILEMLKLKAHSFSKYIISVAAPDIKDAHDDLSDAYARSVFLATEYLSGGGGSSNKIVDTTAGSGNSYKKYYMKNKRSAVYTNRPSQGLQMEMSRDRHMAAGSYGRLGTPIRGRSGR